MKIGDKVKLVQSSDAVYSRHIGLIGKVIKISPDKGGSDLSVDVEFVGPYSDDLPKLDSFYPEELEVLEK